MELKLHSAESEIDIRKKEESSLKDELNSMAEELSKANETINELRGGAPELHFFDDEDGDPNPSKQELLSAIMDDESFSSDSKGRDSQYLLEDRILLCLKEYRWFQDHGMKRYLGVSESDLSRALESLENSEWIVKNGNYYRVTNQGLKQQNEIISKGDQNIPELNSKVRYEQEEIIKGALSEAPMTISQLMAKISFWWDITGVLADLVKSGEIKKAGKNYRLTA